MKIGNFLKYDIEIWRELKCNIEKTVYSNYIGLRHALSLALAASYMGVTMKQSLYKVSIRSL
jgi:hypothetical protein